MRRLRAGFVIAALAWGAARGHDVRADEPVTNVMAPPPTGADGRGGQAPRPWAAGVTPEQQKAALDRMLEGNQLVKESLFVEAAKKYREALESWDHPGIHYNLALALLNLDRPLEVHQQLESALKYGREPLDPEKYDSAQRYLKLVEKQLAPLEITCALYGAMITLDGHAVFKSPGSYQGLVRPGPHTVTATKEGYPTTERTKVLLPGEATKIDLRLYTAGELIEYRRRWPLWRPVVVTIAGAAILGAGITLAVAARDRFDSYDQTIRTDCLNGGCVPPPSTVHLKDEGNRLQRWSTVSFATGGALLAAGVVLLAVDRSTPFRIDPEADESDLAANLTPLLAPGMAGLATTRRF